jgi:GT2 family glycosyltransferase
VFNGAEALGECLASLARWRPEASDIVLVDDASTDERIAPMLSAFAAAHACVTVLAMPANQGFVRAANRGAQVHAQSDVLFLNSDTVVTEGWLEAMRAALEGDPAVAICCPLSNNASLLSVPRFQQENELPEGLDADAMARLVRESAGEPAQLELPTCVGFCMLVRREAWERWGPFDEAFGAGYGEEDDLAQRVRRDGGRISCASNAFVFHRGGTSFGTSQALLARRRVNAAMLLARWPEYSDRVRAFCESNPLRPRLERLWDALMTRAQGFERHVLHVVHRWDETGGIQYHVRDLARATHPVARHTVVVPVRHSRPGAISTSTRQRAT